MSTHDHTDSDLNKEPWESLGTESQDFSFGELRGDKQSAALDGILTSVWSRCRVWVSAHRLSVSPRATTQRSLAYQVYKWPSLQTAVEKGLEGENFLWALSLLYF